MKKYDAIIVGSGIGGLICANYLVKNSNMKVLLVEKNNVIGGIDFGILQKRLLF